MRHRLFLLLLLIACSGATVQGELEQPRLAGPGEACGESAGAVCEASLLCLRAPGDCESGATSCPGLCYRRIFCGGFAGFGCEAGLHCVDDSTDACDPTAGGADCGGLCLPERFSNLPDALLLEPPG
ncbi:MAG: hypothetical protein H7A21_09080 [Spirochaetales bacterium]|nr:hypothetical protein [Leptospiraceae bacterium]MCP5481572.1 hypothetical protein [Spirochaetales bacterium]MCP5484400.1 hypothetical protein [Spirochaetales bacterium]